MPPGLPLPPGKTLGAPFTRNIPSVLLEVKSHEARLHHHISTQQDGRQDSPERRRIPIFWGFCNTGFQGLVAKLSDEHPVSTSMAEFAAAEISDRYRPCEGKSSKIICPKT